LTALLGLIAPLYAGPPGLQASSFEDRLKAGRESWAFSAPKDPPVPVVKDPAWCQSPIDHFVLARLESQGLKPARPADKRTLIRRAYFDLIGLPPTPEQVNEFLQDDSPQAFAKVVDRLLASPQYGERWARHWLDVVRYTDSFDARGVASAGDVKYAWRYRDWVVKAFNEDLPYDQFVTDQIAGDLLPQKTKAQPNADGIVATGIYVMGNWPGGDADREKMMTDIVDDQIDVTGRAFLGLTLACARCHDHKFDPISQRDYYGLAGIFFSSHFLPSPGSKTSGSPLVVTPIATPEQLRHREEYAANLASLEKRLAQETDDRYAKLAHQMLPKAGEYLAAARACTAGSEAQRVEFATERKLDAEVLGRWIDYLGASLNGRPVRKVFTSAVENAGGMQGVSEWKGADGRPDPCVIANNNDHPVSFSTLTIPAKSLSVHPGRKTGVAVGWTSPVIGRVRVRGRVIDADPNCGDGIDWRIERERAGAIETLAAGSFPNGSTQQFSQGEGGTKLDLIDVQTADVLQLTVFPKADYTCDSTIVELQIGELEGQNRVWNLTHDVVPNLLTNPHADSYGNAKTWQFSEAGEESKSGVAGPGSRLAAWLANPSDQALSQVTASLLATDADAPASRSGPDAKLYQDLMNPRGPFWSEARKKLAGLPPESKAELERLSTELQGFKKQAPPPIDEANALLEGGVPQSQYAGIHDSHLMQRGRYDRQAEIVPRGFPQLLAADNPPKSFQGSGRLELARWIASPANPMTAKVMVNRIWQHHFGDGIVRTPNNFGKLGIAPTHPELLDYLARRFVESGWSIKSMHRLIMLSSAYQQSSVPDPQTYRADPDNLLLGHMNRQRLEAEPFRDALLAVSGNLDPTMGGVAFRDPNVPRRTLYLMTIRSDRSNYRTLFDAADPTAIVDKRIDSTVAPQALFLMNDPFVLDRAQALAARVIAKGPPDVRGRIAWLYETLYSRMPTDRELQIGQASVGADVDSWKRYCQVLLCANEFVYVD